MSNGEEANKDVEVFQEQLQQELQKLIEDHNNQVAAEMKRMEDEKLEMQAKFDKEINDLRAECQAKIEEEKKFLQESSKVSKEIFSLQIDELTSPKESADKVNNYSLLIDKFTNIMNFLDKTNSRLEILSKNDQISEESYNQLQAVHRNQTKVLQHLVKIMCYCYHQEMAELFKKHRTIDETYENFFKSV